jgi:uncharacterized membrane protein YidH (DUF202 family)
MSGPAGHGRVWDAGLQPERTALSWRRTGLALLGGSLLLGRALAEVSVPLALTIGTLGVLAAIAILLAVERRYRSHHLRLTAGGRQRVPLAGGALPLVVAATTVVFGGVAAVAAILVALRVS